LPPFAARPLARSACCQPRRILPSQYLRIAFTWISESREVRPHTLSDTTFVGQISRKKRSRPIFSTERHKHDRKSDFFLEIQVRTRSGHGNRGRTRVVRSDCPARLPTLQVLRGSKSIILVPVRMTVCIDLGDGGSSKRLGTNNGL